MKKVTIKGLVITKAIHDRMVQDIEFATGVLTVNNREIFVFYLITYVFLLVKEKHKFIFLH